MPSYYEYHGTLSTATRAAWHRLGDYPDDIRVRLEFYLCYFRDVLPNGVVAFHIPGYVQAFNLQGRYEIQLRCNEGILMTGLLSADNNPAAIEGLTAALTNDHWRDGWLVRNPHQAWGMFTCLDTLSFYISYNGRTPARVSTYRPIEDLRDVAEYIREDYEEIRRR